MNATASSPTAAIFLMLGGIAFSGLGGTHAVYTLLDLRNPRRLVPVDPEVIKAMSNSALRISRGRTDTWRAWIGFNLSHSLGALVLGALGICSACQIKTFPVDIIMPALTLVGCAYELLALLYWFWVPAVGVAVGTGCFAAAWLLSLR